MRWRNKIFIPDIAAMSVSLSLLTAIQSTFDQFYALSLIYSKIIKWASLKTKRKYLVTGKKCLHAWKHMRNLLP